MRNVLDENKLLPVPLKAARPRKYRSLRAKVTEKVGVGRLRFLTTDELVLQPLTEKHTHFINREAEAAGVTFAEMARAMLIDSVELAIAERNDLTRNESRSALRKPLPAELR
jgi:hypothetical protein